MEKSIKLFNNHIINLKSIFGDRIMSKLKFSSSSQLFHAFKYRDRATITSDILTTVKNSSEGRRKTHIMKRANLNYKQTKKYISYLLNCGFLVRTENETYMITKQGTRHLQLIELQKLQSLR
jgi:predicted transcriptional regulator